LHPGRRFAAALALVLAACGGGGGGPGGGDTDPALPPPTSSFAGNVSLNGAPLAGVTIVAFNTNFNAVYGTTTTDAQGNYSFSGLNTSCTDNCIQDYQFLAFKSGYAFSPVLANVPAQYTSNVQWYVPPPGFNSPDNWYNPTGVAITRAGYNGQYVDGSNGVAAPLVYTVFNYSSITAGPAGPTDSITGANFLAFDGSQPLVQLAASGQSVSYVSGDDASMHAGVAWPATLCRQRRWDGHRRAHGPRVAEERRLPGACRLDDGDGRGTAARQRELRTERRFDGGPVARTQCLGNGKPGR
jgi:hypothetical protein